MEESLRQFELRNVYSYCELDDPKFQNFYVNGGFSRREFGDLDLNQRFRDTMFEDQRMRKTGNDRYI